MNIFADRLKKIRKKNKISQANLSDMLGISQNQVSKYEKGVDTPSGTILWKMTHVLKVSAEYLLGVITHVDLEGKYQYMYDSRSALFKAPDGELRFDYLVNGKQETSIIYYAFAIISSKEHVLSGWETVSDPPMVSAEFRSMLYLEEKKGCFLKEMLVKDNELAFGTLDSFLNEKFALGSGYLPETDRPPVEYIIKHIEGTDRRPNPMETEKYDLLRCRRGNRPMIFELDRITGFFWDCYLDKSLKEKVEYLNQLDD